MEEFKTEGTAALQPNIKIPYESEDLSELFTALAKAQLAMEVAKTDSTNPFYKSRYADLASIVKASRKHLAVNGLSVIQRFIPQLNGHGLLLTRLCHASGQWMESRIIIKPAKDDVQTFGSCSTYLKRYSYAAIVGVVAADEDDDGETAMKVARTKALAPKESDKISREQVAIIGREIGGQNGIMEQILTGAGISKISDLPLKRYEKCLEWIKGIKLAKEA